MITGDKSTVKLNCPECKAGYITDREEITSPRPEFDCVSCGVRFYFDYDPAIFFLETEEKSTEEKAKNPQSPFEAQTFKMPLPRVSVPPGIPHELTQSWEFVLRDYDRREGHERFLDLCLKNKKLAFAAQLYRARTEEFPTDQLAREMGDRAFQLATDHLKSLHQDRQLFTTPKRKKPKHWGFWILLVYIGSIVTLAGLLTPSGKTLVLCGVIALTLGIGFKWVAKSPMESS